MGSNFAEHIHPGLSEFLATPIPYKLYNGPDVVADITAARTQGINCVGLAHLAVQRLFGVRLPPLRCFELFSDTEHLVSVAEDKQMKVGDLVWFGKTKPAVQLDKFTPEYDAAKWLQNWRLFPVNHVGVVASEGRDPSILHAIQQEGRVGVWALSRFAGTLRHGRRYGASRLRDDLMV